MRISGPYFLGKYTPADILALDAELLRSEGLVPFWEAPDDAPAA